MELTEASTATLPTSGVLEFDYISTTKAPPDSEPATDEQVNNEDPSRQSVSVRLGTLKGFQDTSGL